MVTALIALVLATDSRTDGKLGDPTPTHSVAVTTAPANPVAAPAPIIVQFHEDAATKDDIRSLGDRLTAAIQPIDHRLSAVERDVTALKLVRQTAPPPPAKAEPAKYYKTDASGIECWDYSHEAVRDRVARRNASFADRSTVVAPQYYVQPQQYAAPALNYGGFSAPMMGGSFGGGGCAGGSCR